MKIEIIRTSLNGLEGKKTEPNRTEHGRFEPVFGSVRFKNLKKNNFGLVFYFGPKPDRTKNAHPYYRITLGTDFFLPKVKEYVWFFYLGFFEIIT
jgi:hypothetical protein